jgi:hypothetical protein
MLLYQTTFNNHAEVCIGEEYTKDKKNREQNKDGEDKELCPTWEQGIAWVLRETWSAWGVGEGGPGPPESKKDKQSALSEGGGSMEKEEEGRTSWA